MKVYEVEKQLGLHDAILAHSRATYNVKIIDREKPLELEKFPLFAEAVSRRDLLPKDLYVFDNIQVSSGWNDNDDIFTKSELWNSRGSVPHKPLNYNHDKDIIIGHTIHSYPVDQNYQLLTEDVPSESLPDLYHIYATDVIYTKSQSPEFDTYIAELINQIKKGEWSVSMECRMEDFDYGLMDSRGNSSILPRNEATAGYTQYLRLFGGSGEYAGYRIGRVFRNITFIGKGVVRTPANPYSIIFSENLFNLGYSKLELSPLEKNMDEKTVEQKLAEAQEALDVALKDAEAAKTDKQELEEKLNKAASDLKDAQAKVTELTPLVEKVDSLTKSVSKANRIDELVKKLADEDILKLLNEASAFVDENVELDDAPYNKVEKYFVQARKTVKAEVTNKPVEVEPDDEEETEVVVAKTTEVKEDNPYDITDEQSLAIASWLGKNYSKTLFQNLETK